MPAIRNQRPAYYWVVKDSNGNIVFRGAADDSTAASIDAFSKAIGLCSADKDYIMTLQ